MSVLDTAEYRRLALIAAGVDPCDIPCILDTAAWRRLMLQALYDLSQGGGGGGGGGYVNGSVQFYADLPVTVGTPAVNTAYLVRENSGVWFINRRPAGIYVRLFNNGNLNDWDYAGTFPEVNDAQYFRIYDSADPTREVAFNVSGVAAATTRTLTVPNANGTIALTSDIPPAFNPASPGPIGNVTPAAGTFTNLVANTELQVPSAAAASPTAGDLYRTTDLLRYRDSSNTERTLLSGAGNLANLTDAAVARGNLGLGSANNVTFASLQGTPIGSTTASSVAATTLSASSTVSGTGFSNYLASPPAIGGTSAAAGSFTTLSASTSLTLGTSGILSGGTNIIEQRNTTSAQTFRIYNTVSGAADANFERGFIGWSSNTLRIGTEAGGTGSARALEFQTGGTTRLTIATTGSATFTGAIATSGEIYAGTTSDIRFTSSTRLSASANGSLRLSNNALTDFDRLQFGGTTSSFPALKRSSTALQVRLADDSGYTVLDAQLRAQGTAPATSGAAGTAGDIRYDADYIYVCTAANTWKRAAIATW